MNKLQIICAGTRKAYTLRKIDGSVYSADISESERRGGRGYESEAKAPREIIVGLAAMYGVPKDAVMLEIDAEEQEYENHLNNFKNKLDVLNAAVSSGQLTKIDEADDGVLRRWAVKLSLVMNYIILYHANDDHLFIVE